jgi:hypothetical protein
VNYIELLRLTAVDDPMTGAHRLRCDTCRKWFAYWIDIERVFDMFWREKINELCRQHLEASPKCKYVRLHRRSN